METINAIAEALGAEVKVCTKCEIEQELTEYYMSRGKPQSQCKSCARKQKKDYKARKRVEDKAKKKVVDELLDKISQKGYHFLTDEEKEFLKRASKEG